MHNEEIYKCALQKFGLSKQLDKLVEECAECIHIAIKIKNNFKNHILSDKMKLDFIKECIDVNLMCEQMFFNFKTDFDGNKLNELIAEKLYRFTNGKGKDE